MKKVLKVLFIIVLAIGLPIAGFFVYQMYFAKSGGRDAMSLIPPNVVFVIETNDITEAWQAFSSSAMWRHLLRNEDFKEFDTEINQITDLMNNNAAVKMMLENRDIYIAAHTKAPNDYDFMFVVDLQKTSTLAGVIEEGLKHIGYNYTETEYLGVAVHELIDPNDAEFKMYLSMVDNLFIGTFDKSVLENAIKNRDDNVWGNNVEFQEVFSELGSKKLFSFYFNYDQFAPFIKVFLEEDNETVAMIGNSLLYSALDMYFADERLSFKGFTNLDSLPSFVTALASVAPGKTRAHEILSNQTAFYFSMSFDSYKELQNKMLEQYKEEAGQEYEDYEKNLKLVERILGMTVNEALFDWFGNEIAVAKLRPTFDTRAEDILALIHANDIDLAKESLEKMLTKIRRRTGMRFDDIQYKNFTINYLETERGFFMLLFGKLFEDLEKPYFTFIDDYVLFSNSMETLKGAIDDYVAGRTLAHDAKFMAFKDEFNVKGNISIFIQMPKIYSNLYYYAQPDSKEEIQQNKDLILSFAKIGFQLVNENDMLTTTFIAEHDSTAMLDDKLEQIAGDATQELFNRHVDTLGFKIIFPDDKVVTEGKYTMYYENGTIQAEGNIVNGNPDGLWRSYYPSGNISSSITYVRGMVNMQAIFYYDNVENVKLADAEFVQDKIEGLYREYYDNGARKTNITYKDGVMDGLVEFYYPTGDIKISGEYKDGLKDGKWEFYDENGIVISKERWKNGEKK